MGFWFLDGKQLVSVFTKSMLPLTFFYKKWPSDKANHNNYGCEIPCKLLYIIQVKGSFLALPDIKGFGCL